MRAWGARYARLVFDRCQQNKRRACDALDISYHTLMAYLQHGPESMASKRHRVAWAAGAADGSRASALAGDDAAPERPVSG
jgi:hypothetical protein